MSKSEEKRKRKRQDDAAEDAPKKSKKSKKSKDPTAEDAPANAEDVVAVQKKKKDKKAKKAKKSSDETIVENVAAATNGIATDLQQDFITFDNDDEPMLNATNGAISRTASKKLKKDKKDKKSKKVNGAIETEPAKEAATVEEPTTTDEKADKKKSKKEKKSKKIKETVETIEEPANGVPEPMDADAASEKEVSVSEEVKNKAKKEKKEKKSNKPKDGSEPVQEEPAGVDGAAADEAPVAGKSKKDKKKSMKDKKTKEEPVSEPTDTAIHNEEAVEAMAEDGGEQDANGDASEEKKGRFIVFVGNLPFSATKETIEAHFVKLKPFEIRMRTYKKDNKFMGTCFIEFEHFDRMQTALQKYHHSTFSDGTKKNDRKINVELSAGGGGNTPARMDKIRAKNEKLSNERQRIRERREEVESKQKERKEKKDTRGKTGDKHAGDEAEEPAVDNGGMHPARLAMMNQPAPARKGRQRY